MRVRVPLRLSAVRRALWARRRAGIWLAVAVFAALDGLPTAGLHPLLTLLAVLLTAAWMYNAPQRTLRRALRQAHIRIGELRNRADAFELAATVDPVTTLANRQAFYTDLRETLAKPLEGLNGAPALILLDLDRFKRINDRYGHAAGDAVLVRVARILRQESRAEDVAGRLGGDEFGLLLRRTTPEGLARIMRRLKAATESRPLYVSRSGDEVFGSFSLGGAMLSEHPDIDELLIATDRPLYADKARLGRSRAA